MPADQTDADQPSLLPDPDDPVAAAIARARARAEQMSAPVSPPAQRAQAVATPPAEGSIDLLDGLNDDQRRAVVTTQGPVLCVAGAGSGKTRVLTHRIAHLIRDHGVSPYEVIAITFTNKAANEMLGRLDDLLGGQAPKRMWVTTFHKACVRILRSEVSRLGWTGQFTIYDAADAQRLVSNICREIGHEDKQLTPRSISHAISRAKDDLVDHETYRQQSNGYPDVRVAEVYRMYQERLQQNNAFDFDDLIVKTVELFQLFPELLTQYQERFKYLMVDEYQDTNRAQYHLVNQLAGGSRNIMVVGDGDQGVYGWRGATIRNILDFERDYPDATVIGLTRNYRSSSNILDAANTVIRNNDDRLEKDLWTDRPAGEPIVRYRADDEHDEAAWIAEEIGRHRNERRSYEDVAILYRTNAQSRVLEEVFVRVGVPYRVIGGVRFYERREVKDILGYLRLLVNDTDDIATDRVINVPKRGVGDKSIAALAGYAAKHKISMLEACRQADRVPRLSGRAVGGVQGFVEVVDQLREAAAANMPVNDLVALAWDKSGYMAELLAESSIEAEGRIENLKELRSVAAELDERGELSGAAALAEFLETTTLVSDQDALVDAPDGQVTMMTLHAAKGLEYPTVFLIGMEDGIFPHVRTLSEPDQLEEERRLAYVGITRAEDRLYVTHADHRTLWGGSSYNPPSRFLSEIPAHLVRERSSRGRGGSGSAAQRVRDAEVLAVEGVEFAVNDRVLHPKFGPGVITELGGEGERAEALVIFDQHGAKQLMLAYAPLVRA
ncbi:MAG: DNA helicase-2/ATP-dependent DNA helicase PcrA [Myxococcota bacterium]